MIPPVYESGDEITSLMCLNPRPKFVGEIVLVDINLAGVWNTDHDE
jgi:hypothetical protein